MLKIGDFSKLAHVTVKTLRHYAQIGLLSPAWIDRYTGYRYYGLDQLPRLNRILALKDLGFSLQQVSKILNEDLSIEQLRGMVRLRQAELQRQIEEQQRRLFQVQTRLGHIEREGLLPPYEVVIKSASPANFASIRELVPTIDALPAACKQMASQITAWIESHHIRADGPWTAIYYNPEFTEKHIEVELGVPVQAPNLKPSGGRINLRLLPGVAALACVVHPGGRDNVLDAYTAFYRWSEASEYRVNGPVRELYIGETSETDLYQNKLTELQFPVEHIVFPSPKGNEAMENEIEPKIVTLPAFLVAGTLYQGNNQNNECAKMWADEFLPRLKEFNRIEEETSYGVCYLPKGLPDGVIEYIACVKIKSPDEAPAGMVTYKVPEQRYAVFEQHGSLQALFAMNNYIYQSWLPKSGYRRTEGPDLEVYTSQFNNFKEDSLLYLYVPVEEVHPQN